MGRFWRVWGSAYAWERKMRPSTLMALARTAIVEDLCGVLGLGSAVEDSWVERLKGEVGEEPQGLAFGM